jgi:hypothetical protein
MVKVHCGIAYRCDRRSRKVWVEWLRKGSRVTLEFVRKWRWAALAGVMIAALGLAWADGGIVPLRPISQPVALPGLQP